MTEYKSEIRDSQIRTLLERAKKRSFNKYLCQIKLTRIRGFSNQVVSFDFPVTALVGPNGGGKTTILGAAACAYKEIKPRRYFAKSGKLDNSMRDWTLEYEAIDRNVAQDGSVRRTASFKNLKWDRGVLDRKVLVFGIARTVPPNERTEFQRYASNTFAFRQDELQALEANVLDAAGKILGKDMSGYQRLSLKSGRSLLLAAMTRTAEFSEFHFGAGESSVIRMITEIEAAPDGTLVLIEEIENGLHPLATMRMVEYLADLAERKRIQAIFTTHSNEALKPLPPEAVWVALDGRATQGKPDIKTLRKLQGAIDTRLVIFVEDDFAADWVIAALRMDPAVALDAVQLLPMSGDGSAVAMNRNHRSDPAATVPSICFIDGDSPQTESEKEMVLRLPGGVPESHVFDSVLEVFDEWGGKLAVALHLRFDDQARVKDVLRDIRTTNRDPHLLFSQVGDRLGLIAEKVVRGAFLSIWAQAFSDKAAALRAAAGPILPRTG